MIESSSASSSLNAVNIRQATSGTRERTSRQTDTIRPPNIEHGDAGAQRRALKWHYPRRRVRRPVPPGIALRHLPLKDVGAWCGSQRQEFQEIGRAHV